MNCQPFEVTHGTRDAEPSLMRKVMPGADSLIASCRSATSASIPEIFFHAAAFEGGTRIWVIPACRSTEAVPASPGQYKAGKEAANKADMRHSIRGRSPRA